jgi:RNA polymerase sigma factor (sigma-70 family)
MPAPDDIALLREYVESHSEAAFTTLVERHVNLVYSAALRSVDNQTAAQEIAQAVFIVLARKAKSLGDKTVLSGWLYQTARLTAANYLRGEIRRQHREQEAYMQTILNEPESREAWRQIAPLLDDAMGRLGEKDRNAILLRFFENKNLSEVGAVLGASEDAAKMRVNRALEKLRKFFAKQGVDSTAATIAETISTHSIQAAPAALAKAVAATALANGATASASTLTLIKGALKIMAWTKTKTAIVAGVAVILGLSTTVVVVDATLPSPEIQGTWMATEVLGGWGIQADESPKTRLLLKIAKVNGNFQVTGNDIDRGYKDVPVNVFTYKHRRIHAEIFDIPDTFDGAANLAGTKISGRWKEGKGGSGSLVFTRIANPPPFPEALTDAEFAPRTGSDLQGLWQGWIGSGNGMIHFEIKIADLSDGTFRADFYSPDQKAVRQPTSVSYDGTTVKLVTMAGYGMFQGELLNRREMSGVWIQNGRHTPTKVARVK